MKTKQGSGSSGDRVSVEGAFETAQAFAGKELVITQLTKAMQERELTKMQLAGFCRDKVMRPSSSALDSMIKMRVSRIGSLQTRLDL